jgi:hypothetical protein
MARQFLPRITALEAIQGHKHEMYVLLCDLLEPGDRRLGCVQCMGYVIHVFGMTSFDQELSSWNTSTMEGMFVNSLSFHQDVFSWGWNRRSWREALWLPNDSSS